MFVFFDISYCNDNLSARFKLSACKIREKEDTTVGLNSFSDSKQTDLLNSVFNTEDESKGDEDSDDEDSDNEGSETGSNEGSDNEGSEVGSETENVVDSDDNDE